MGYYPARLTSRFSPVMMAGIPHGQLNTQELFPIQLTKVECSANPIDGDTTFTAVDEIVSSFFGKEIARGTMKRVHQASLNCIIFLVYNLTLTKADSEWSQLCC